MPREASITYEQVAAIADAIKAAGGKPNPRQIRERHGSGSLGTIHKLFQQWESGQSRQIEAALALPPALQRAILEFMDQELTAARAELESKLSDAQQAANDLAAENERQAGQIEALETTVEDLQGEKATLAGRVAQLETDLATARDEAGRERQAAEAARTELAKAQLRLEAMPILEKENERLQGALDAERTARTDAERQAAAAEAKAAGLADRLADAQEHQKQTAAELAKSNSDRQRLAGELSEIQKEARAASSQAGQLQGTVSTLQRQVEEQAAIIKTVKPAPAAKAEKPAKTTGKAAPAAK
ncbi:DNA-binding protein [Azonexus sp. IMCC34839]|uniref:DNA-binding protein n=1 Tax=Azonexus sp. IMCC34839 TaxID=3133695 RepID=UPI00399A0B77